MPVFTAAPFPLLYGWRITRAPAAAASRAVSSVEPSSTTTISRHAAAACSPRTTAPIDAASLKAGMTTDVASGPLTALGREAEVDDVAVLHDVVLAFEAHFTVVPAG